MTLSLVMAELVPTIPMGRSATLQSSGITGTRPMMPWEG